MTLFKRGTQDSSIVVSSSIYSCSSCDYTEIAKDAKNDKKKCPECGAEMTLISSHAEDISNSDV